MTYLTRIALCLLLVGAAAAAFVLILNWDMPLATGIAFVLALWAGRAWQKIEDGR